MKTATLLLIIITACTTASADIKDESIVHAIIGEAADQPFDGQIAIACGIKNRPEGLEGVYGARMTRKPSKSEIYNAWYAYIASKTEGTLCHDLIAGADMFCSDVEICHKSWKGIPMVFILKIGDFSFYRRIKYGR